MTSSLHYHWLTHENLYASVGQLHTLPVCMHNAGDIDMHFFLKYEWPAGVDDAAHSAFAQERLRLMAPHVTSTQVDLSCTGSLCTHALIMHMHITESDAHS